MASSPAPELTEQQYLVSERAADYRSEFLDGVMYAMSGGSPRHADLHGNIYAELRTLLRGGPCKAYNSDLRVRVSSRMYTYPDVSVVCGEPSLGDEEDNLLNPVVIIEVLSPSTERYDRGLKFQQYRTIPSLREYVLVEQNKIQVEQYIRQDDGTWKLRDHQGMGAEVKMDSIGATLPLRLIHDGVDFAN